MAKVSGCKVTAKLSDMKYHPQGILHRNSLVFQHITMLQQVFMLIDHAEAKHAIHCDDELGECHTFNRLPLHRNGPSPSQ